MTADGDRWPTAVAAVAAEPLLRPPGLAPVTGTAPSSSTPLPEQHQPALQCQPETGLVSAQVATDEAIAAVMAAAEAAKTAATIAAMVAAAASKTAGLTADGAVADVAAGEAATCSAAGAGKAAVDDRRAEPAGAGKRQAVLATHVGVVHIDVDEDAEAGAPSGAPPRAGRPRARGLEAGRAQPQVRKPEHKRAAKGGRAASAIASKMLDCGRCGEPTIAPVGAAWDSVVCGACSA